MKQIIFLLLVVSVFSCGKKRTGRPRVLVFSRTAGFYHTSIPAGIAAIQKLGAANGFQVDTTKNAAYFRDDSLKQYAAVIFLSTTGNVLDSRQEIAFERYIQAGGGFVGLHAATSGEYDWGWYGKLIGARFDGHPAPQSAKFRITDTRFIATRYFPDSTWVHKDELSNYKQLSPDIHVLVTLDEKSYKGGTNGAFHPISWYHAVDGGRSFFTGLGHADETYLDPIFVKHLFGGIQYAISDNRELNYSLATSEFPPDEDRFSKTQLVQGELYEPTEMTILPNLDVLIVERRGQVMLYKNDTKKIKQAGLLNVYFKTKFTPSVNAEEGLLGIAKDPNYAKNNWVYLYYSPADSAVNRLSRFTFKNDTLDLATEKTIVEVGSQREICCHTGGSIAFGPDGLLYFSTGDNSTPFDEPNQKFVNHGFGPLNDAPGHEQYDARRSSGNTNDLRGKINRIRIKDDGTYEIPKGNLFPKGTPKTRPEIYVMGNRNPYRISVDQKNGNLYWGEVGPDAANDSLTTRGPRGYDELNQARAAGFFGWPLFVGKNYPYHEYDYTTGKPGAAFDPLKPVNTSRNNTGLKVLPPVAPAFIWYPYAKSSEFPQTESGGRNAMAGPVYYADLFPKKTRLPDYYNGKLIIYDWIRGWIKAVTLQPNEDFYKMEPFLENIKVHSLIDMEVGPDGRLYFLEYGSGWYTKNPDAGLARIDYNDGNRPPKIADLQVNKSSGLLPFSVKVSAAVTDPENDNVSYKWNPGDGTTKETKSPVLDYVYTTPGDYKISLEAIDSNGASSNSEPVEVYAGNDVPIITIELPDGATYVPGKPVIYSVVVSDKLPAVPINPANLFVSVEYIEGYDKASSDQGHRQMTAAIAGKNLTLSLDCKSCHKEKDKSIGPSFVQVSKKYPDDSRNEKYLADKIVKGGSGVWGETAMAAHPSLSAADVHEMITYILSLEKPSNGKKSLPSRGAIVPPATLKPNTTMVISASYTDAGGQNIKPLTGSGSARLKLK